MPATAKKTKAPRKKKPAQTQAAQNARKQMWVVVLFALGLLLGALAFIKGDKLWLWLHECLFGLFGWGSYVMPPLVIYAAVMSAMDKPLAKVRNKLWQIAALVLMVSAAVQIFFYELPSSDDFVENLSRLYEDGQELHGGGAAGMLALPLNALFGEAGASIILLLAIFVFLMLVTGSTLISLYHKMAKPVKDLEEAYVSTVESREQRRQEKLAATAAKPARAKTPPAKPAKPDKRFDYDVDISGDTMLSEDDGAPPWEEGPAPVPVPAPPKKKEHVEYISPEEFARPAPLEAEPPPPQPVMEESRPLSLLEEDILRAEQQAEADIDEVLRRFSEHGADDDEAPGEAFAAQNTVAPETAFGTGAKPKRVYRRPPSNLLKNPGITNSSDITQELRQNAQTLVDTLKSFGVETRITDVCRGPAVTRYELQPSAGVKINRITGLADDIALNLAAAGIRIEAPIPGKAAVGIEVPNKVVSIVSIRELLDSEEFRNAESNVTVALGRDIAGNVVLADIAKMPHALIAGTTGSGKSVCINSVIISLLYKASPEDVKLLMIDPKVVELGVYNGIPHLLVPVVTDPKKAAGALSWAVAEMERRYREFGENGVRDLIGYNRLAGNRGDRKPMPQIVVIIDELADLMMIAKKEVEDSILRLAQKARAAGMHLVVATQRPSVDVITGVIKANIPSRIAFAVASQVDSGTILGMGGAEKLLGRGDMLFYPVGAAKPMRVQGCFVTDSEVESVVEFIKAGESAEYDSQIADEIDRHQIAEKGSPKDGGGFESDEDELLPQAIECVVEAGMASTSHLQRRLKLGYARAARIIDQLEERGIVGPFEGSKPRQVLITRDRWLEMKLRGE